MKIFAVRLIHDKTAVGFFWANNWTDLNELVDECTNSNMCEFVEVKECGGFLWKDPTELTMGVAYSPELLEKIVNGEIEINECEGLSISELTAKYFDQNIGGWRDVVPT